MCRLFSYALLWLFLPVISYGQNALPIGQWRAHLPYWVGQNITQSNSKIYYATELSVLIQDKEENSIDFLTTVEGLSNTGIDQIKYNPFDDVLVIVYSNSVIDLVRPEGIATMNQIKNFNNSTGDKSINDVYIQNDSMLYLAARFGISRVNMAALEFDFTTFTGIPIEEVLIYQGAIYAATEEGIYSISENALTPENFGAWTLLGPNEGFPPDYSSNSMVVYEEALYTEVNDTLFRLGASGLEFIHHEPGHDIKYMTAEGAHLMVYFRCTTGDCGRGAVHFFNPDGSVAGKVTQCLGDSRYAIEDEGGKIWFADGFRNFRSLDGIDDQQCNTIAYNSPYTENSAEIFISDNQVWLAAGGVDQRFNNRFSSDGFASFIEGEWTIYNRNTYEPMKGENPNDPNDDLLDILSVAVHPENGKIYAASYFEGLLEIDGEQATIFNEKNSSLGNAVGDGSRTRVSGLAFDEDKNLWVSNFLATRPLSVLTNDGTWKNFGPACRETQLHQIGIDENSYKWIVVNGGQAGVLLFDSGVLEDDADDRCRVFSSSNSELPTNQVNCLEVDRDGDVWVGTSEGVIIFECGSNAFDPNCRGTRRVIQQDGVNAYLLGTEDIQSIAVDGANRKWVGTRNGIFVLSPNGEDQIARFTTGDSPLPDNFITDIAVNQQNGEVFIGTNKGVISYQSDAVEGPKVFNAQISVFPNPVRPDYQGPIAIKGLAEDADVKITDINGKLVFETQALGGQAIWDGRDYTGRRANSGVYLVFSTSNPRNVGFSGKPDGAIAKIVLLN